MVPTEIKNLLARSFEQMRITPILDDTTLKNCSNEIARALLDADFPESLVAEFEGKIQTVIDTNEASEGKCNLIYKVSEIRFDCISVLIFFSFEPFQTILEELSTILDPRKSASIQGKNESIVMFIGLQGSEKSYTCARYARYHMTMGFKPALVCADTFAIDAFDLLKKASKDKVPVYRSRKRDPAKIASGGIAKLRKHNRDFIVVDTTSRHTECFALLVEMRRLANAVKPDLVIFVIDGSVGKDAFEQARAFREGFPAGVAIVTKIKTYPKSLGALAAVAAAECPMIYSTKGEKGEEFKVFEAESFVRQLMPNQDHEREDKTPELAYTLRKMHAYFSKACQGKVLRGPRPLVDIPTMKLYIQIMDNMTSEELEKSEISKERMVHLAEQSNVDVIQVVGMMTVYKRKAKAWLEIEERMGKLNSIYNKWYLQK
ncbi:signal recognition particle 54 kDa protein 2 isoform X2 [Brassica rapa]|uniref:signal recognition particle 54 kDa protein 2 isoform X2 n=1 Tax=Brassica campestris TaxID=3711 RepID=UPI00142D7364|nr:signal recognition particle 54 kDa protein 2 isoform X2 [Brassica rapa]